MYVSSLELQEIQCVNIEYFIGSLFGHFLWSPYDGELKHGRSANGANNEVKNDNSIRLPTLVKKIDLYASTDIPIVSQQNMK
jgi:hypothetical protein